MTPTSLPLATMTSRLNRRPSLPTIPDLRFESSYLARVRPHIHLTRATPSPTREPSHDFDIVYDEKAAKEKETQQEVLLIDWGRLVWVTFLDQVLLVGLQGAAWYVAPADSAADLCLSRWQDAPQYLASTCLREVFGACRTTLR